MNTQSITQLLRSNPYPGRGILLGRSLDDKKAIIAYFIMGRSENSRNRIFEATPDGIRTRALDESKVTDPSLIIYHPIRTLEQGLTIVSNGDQTDTIRDSILAGHCYRHALNTREFEPDGPHYTPRISGLVKPDGSYNLSILKTLDGNPACCCRFFYEYDAPAPGTGHLIHTYLGDGNPLPSFQGEPVLVGLDAPDANTLAQELWSALNSENKVSLCVRWINLETKEMSQIILNQHGSN